MTTWRLWHALRSPPSEHPIFQRMVSPYYDDIQWVMVAQNVLIQGQIWFWSLIFVFDTRALILMILSGTLYGMIWSIIVSGTIAIEREYRMYDLLCLSPSGKLGISWAICMGCLHRNRTFEHVNSQESWSIRIILFIPLVISANVLLGRMFSNPGSITAIWLVAFLIVFYLDHVQSIIFGSLLGVLAPHYASNRFDSRLWACTGFLLVQCSSYLALFVTSAFLLPTLYKAVGIGGWYADISLPILSVAAFYFLREVIMARLWHLLIEQLNAAPIDLDLMFEQAAS
jgi:hypothetical protein